METKLGAEIGNQRIFGVGVVFTKPGLFGAHVAVKALEHCIVAL
jgi:hypothetical protein